MCLSCALDYTILSMEGVNVLGARQSGHDSVHVVNTLRGQMVVEDAQLLAVVLQRARAQAARLSVNQERIAISQVMMRRNLSWEETPCEYGSPRIELVMLT